MWQKTPEHIKNEVCSLIKRLSSHKSNHKLKKHIYAAVDNLQLSWNSKDVYDIWLEKFPDQLKRYVGYSILIHKDLGVIAWGKDNKDFYSMIMNLNIECWSEQEKAKTLITTIPVPSHYSNTSNTAFSSWLGREEREGEQPQQYKHHSHYLRRV